MSRWIKRWQPERAARNCCDRQPGRVIAATHYGQTPAMALVFTLPVAALLIRWMRTCRMIRGPARLLEKDR